jgi:hypothetical protein
VVVVAVVVLLVVLVVLAEEGLELQTLLETPVQQTQVAVLVEHMATQQG